MSDVPVGQTAFTDNALMVQNGSMYLGAYPAAYTGVKPAKSSGEGRARRVASAARRAARAGARREAEARRRAEGAANAIRFEDAEDAFSAAEADAEMAGGAASAVPTPKPPQASAPAPTDSMVVADVSTGRKRDAGAAFRREMATRVDNAERAEVDREYDEVDSLADGWPDEFRKPHGE